MSIHLDHQTLGNGSLQAGPAHPVPVKPDLPRLSPVARVVRGTFVMLSSTAVVGVLVIGGVVAAEHFAPTDWRPSTLLGAFGGRKESAQMLASLDAARAMTAMQKQEEARALQEVEVLRANNERVTQAYGQLYQRGTVLAQQWGAAATDTLKMNTMAKVEGLRGTFENSATKDRLGMWCDGFDILMQLGGSRPSGCGDQLRASAANDRANAQAEIIRDFKSQSALIATSLRDWAQGLPDPAEVVAYQNRIGQTVPTARAPVPPAPLPTTAQTSM